MNSQMGIRDNIRKHIGVLGYGGNISKFAKEKGFSNSYLNEILNGKRRFNEDWLNKIAKALEVEPWQLLSDRLLVPYESKEPTLVFNMPEGEIEGVKVFDTPACLGPGFNMDECAPAGYMPIPKKDLPRGYKSDSNRIICLPTKGTSMVPTILPDSYIWVDRYVPAETVLIFETDGGWNLSGSRELLLAKPRHGNGYVVGFADGHAELVRPERLEKLRWEP